MSVLRAAPGRRELPPVQGRGRWLAWGLVLQVIGVGIPVTVALRRAHEDGLGGAVTHYTVRLVWHEMLHRGGDVALIVLGVLLFAAGTAVLARPFVRRPVTLLIAVPLAAVAGLALFGVLALMIAAIVAGAAATGEAPPLDELLSNLPFGDWSDRRRRK